MTDHEILARIGLTDEEATDACRKLALLSAAQTEAIKTVARINTNWKEAAAAIGPDCTIEDLRRFMEKRKGHHPSVANNIFDPAAEC